MIRRLPLARALALVLATAIIACSSGVVATTTSSTTTTPTITTTLPVTTTMPPPTTTTVPVSDIVESPLMVRLEPYGPQEVVVGEVFASWYLSDDADTYIVLYAGSGLADAVGLCPGNSMQTGGDFNPDWISHAPPSTGSCDGFPTNRGSVRVCDHGVWIYRTLIPGDQQGVLWATLETFTESGSLAVIGSTSRIDSQGDLPTITFLAGGYRVPASLTDDGSTEISCGEPLT